MTRNQSTMSLNSSCLRVPINPYSQQPSPAYERRLIATPNTEDEGSSAGKFCVDSSSSRPASRRNSPASKRTIISKSIGGKQTQVDSNNSPLDSFLDFYESIPDYQDVTHLSDKEFADKMKLLRNKQREYLHNLDGRFSPREFEACQAEATSSYEKKTCKSVNKFELAKEWLNKSCDSLSSLGKKSENDFHMRSLQTEYQSKKAPSANISPRKYVQYDVKNDSEANIVDSGSCLSTDCHTLKSKASAPSFVKEEHKKQPVHNVPDFDSPFNSTGRPESCRGISNLFGAKERSTSSNNNYDFYNRKETVTSTPAKNSCHQSCALQSSETSELNTELQYCNNDYGLSHHDRLNYVDYYVPSPGWIQSDSDSMLGTMHNIPSTMPSPTIMSQSLPGSPITKRSINSSKTSSSKKKTRRKRRGPQKSVTKPVPFNFISNERQYTRSTPDLSSHCRSPSPKHFRARPIPRNLFSNYVYQKKQEDEFFRALKRKVRAEEMLRAASLPPSMEFRERLVRVQAEAEGAEASLGHSSSSDHSGGAAVSVSAGTGTGTTEGRGRERSSGKGPPPPRRGKRQGHRGRQGRDVADIDIASSPSPYSLRTMRTASLSPGRKQGSVSSGSDSRRCRPRPRSGCANHVGVVGLSKDLSQHLTTSRSNLAALLRIQSVRQRLEAEHHRLREDQARRAEMRLKERLTRLTPAWRSIQYSTEEDLALRAAARREEERQRRLEHGVLMRHMLHRVHTIPTLFERQSAALSRSPRSKTAGLDMEGPFHSATDDEDAADVKVFVPGAGAAFQRGPRQSRPCSADPADAGMWRPRVPTTDKSGVGVTAVCAALRSPDRASNRLRTYHRQLPHAPRAVHRVEFSEQSVRGPRGPDQDQDHDEAVAEEDGEEDGDGSARARDTCS